MNILFLTHRLPYAPNRGDRIRAYYLMREMAKFSRVTLFSLVHDDDERRRASDVPFAAQVVTCSVPRIRNLALGLARLPLHRPLTHSLLDAGGIGRALERLVATSRPDLVVAFCSGMARFALEPPLNAFPFVLDMVDVDSEKWRQMAAESVGPKRWIYDREATTLRAFETRASEKAAVTLIVNERERDVLVAFAPRAQVTVIPNGIDLATFAPSGPPEDAPVVVFCGVMDYYPNDEGVQWFVREVWPDVLRSRPDARFVVVGREPTRALRNLAREQRSIEIVGSVPSVQPYLWKSAVSIAPLRLARGLQNKVLEAIAAGLPVVVTPAVLGGLPDQVHTACRVAEGATDFSAAVTGLLNCPASSRRNMATEARLRDLDWAERLGGLERILENASQCAARPAGRS